MKNQIKRIAKVRWPKFNVYDFFIIATFCILYFYLFSNWDVIKCEHPINLWLAIDYVLLLVVRIVFVIKHSGYSYTVVKICRVIFYLLVFPFMLAWSILGLVWGQEALRCIPDDLVPWSYFLWLVITLIGGIVLIADLVYDIVQYRKLRKFIKHVDEADQPHNESLIMNNNEIGI